MAGSDPKRALASLQLAGEIKPDHPRVCLARARAHARLKQTRKALLALDCAAASGRVTAAVVENDTDLATLAGEKGYNEILARLQR